MRQFVSQHTRGLAVTLLLLAITCLSMTSLQETDIFWSIREGERLLATGNFMPVETWNFLAAGRTWTPNSWLWNVVLAITWQAGQIYGLALLNAACFAAMLVLIHRLGRRVKAARVNRYLVLVVGATLFYSFFSDRAIQADILLLFCYALTTATLRNTKHVWIWLCVSTLAFAALGMNLHLTAPIYVGLFPMIALATLLPRISHMSQRVGLLIATGFVTLLGVLCSPYGVDGVLKSLIVSDSSRNLIIEWQPPRWDTYVGITTWLIIALGLLLVLHLLRKRNFFPVIPLVLLIIASSQATRFSLYLAVLVTIFTLLFADLSTWQRVRVTRVNLPGLALFGAGVILLLTLVPTLTALTDPARIIRTGPGEFTHIPANARVLSSPASGSSVLFFRPDARVALDGRNDLIGRTDYTRARDAYYHEPIPALRSYLNAKRIDAIYLAKTNEFVTTARLDQLGWHRYEARWGWTYLRPTVDVAP